MSEFKGTKGEWFIDKEEMYENEYGVLVYPISTEYTKNICDVYGYYEEEKANALLISKAPEMLEMLIELKDTLSYGRTFGYNDYDRVEKLIKEATEL